MLYYYGCQYDIVFNGTKSQIICFDSEWDKETAELHLGIGMLQILNELKWLGIYFGADKHFKIVMHENRRKYFGFLAGIVQKAGYVNKECLVKILLRCLFSKLIYGTCCTVGVKSILNPLNVALNDGFRKFFNIARHTSVRMIINDFNVLPVSLTDVCNLFYILTANCSSGFKI